MFKIVEVYKLYFAKRNWERSLSEVDSPLYQLLEKPEIILVSKLSDINSSSPPLNLVPIG